MGHEPHRRAVCEEPYITMATSYYMLRIHDTTGQTADLSGAVERLGTGEKRSFESGNELLQVLRLWPTRTLKMQGAEIGGKPSDP